MARQRRQRRNNRSRFERKVERNVARANKINAGFGDIFEQHAAKLEAQAKTLPVGSEERAHAEQQARNAKKAANTSRQPSDNAWGV